MFSGAQFTGLKITNVRYAHLIFWHKAALFFIFFLLLLGGMGGVLKFGFEYSDSQAIW